MIRRLAFAFVVLSALTGAGRPAFAQALRRECLNPAETLEAIAQHRLVRPGDALSAAAFVSKAEALSAKLCRWDSGYKYEITLLRRDGKIIRAHVDAASGLPVEP
ncbi:MAG: hypothetical protein HZY79_15065 [Rhodoblastus sp.]|nr:MAG: hypothetical protein HZY79_15065 [Rhodoblastus sp.]